MLLLLPLLLLLRLLFLHAVSHGPSAAPTAAPPAAPPTADLPLVPLSCPLVALSRYPVGKLTERLPNGSLLNPCPFNGKEHCIIMTIALVSEGHTRDTTIRY